MHPDRFVQPTQSLTESWMGPVGELPVSVEGLQPYQWQLCKS